MAERGERVVRSEPGVAAEHVDAVVTDPYAKRRATAYKVRQAIYLIFGIVQGLIAIRFILRALGANPEAGFASFINGVTAPLLVPFVGLFRPVALNGMVLELHSIVAIIVYALLAWVLAKLAWLLLGETRRGVRTHSSSVDTDAG
jgi:hypothetical protein